MRRLPRSFARSARPCWRFPEITTSPTAFLRASPARSPSSSATGKRPEPVFRSPTLHVVGLNSVRPWRHQSGGIRESQLERARELLAEAPEGALRVVTLHHHLIGAPWRSRKRAVSRRSHVLASLVDSGAELILAGHIHQAAVAERHEFEVIRGDVRGVVVSIAPGLGQPRPKRRGEARGLHVYESERGLDPRPDLRLARRRLGAHGRAPLRPRPRAARRRGTGRECEPRT